MCEWESFLRAVCVNWKVPERGGNVWRVSQARCVCERESFLKCGVCMCVCVLGFREERTGGSLMEDGMCAETLDFFVKSVVLALANKRGKKDEGGFPVENPRK